MSRSPIFLSMMMMMKLDKGEENESHPSCCLSYDWFDAPTPAHTRHTHQS